MDSIKKQWPSIKYQLVCMWVYFFAAYLPFFIFMLVRHNVSTTSMSAIGWITGGIHYLFLYIIITVPFCLYQIFFFNRHFIGNNKFINAMSVISCALITLGTFIPLRQHYQFCWTTFAHTILCIGGAILLMLTISFALMLRAIKEKHKTVLLSLYGIYAALLVTAFCILGTAALFQLSITLSFFLILLFANTTLVILSRPSSN